MCLFDKKAPKDHYRGYVTVKEKKQGQKIKLSLKNHYRGPTESGGVLLRQSLLSVVTNRVVNQEPEGPFPLINSFT